MVCCGYARYFSREFFKHKFGCYPVILAHYFSEMYVLLQLQVTHCWARGPSLWGSLVMQLCLIIFHVMFTSWFVKSLSRTLMMMEILGSKQVAVIHYATLHSLCYLFRDNCYCHDIRGRRSGNDMPEWRKIVLGYKYNNEEMLQFFQVPQPLFFRLVRSCIKFAKASVASCQHPVRTTCKCSGTWCSPLDKNAHKFHAAPLHTEHKHGYHCGGDC